MSALRLLFVVTALLNTGFAASRVIISYRALDLGATAGQVGFLVAAHALLPLVAALRIGRAVDRGVVTRTMRWGAFLAAVGLGLIAWSNALWVLAAAAAISGFAQMCSMIAAQGFLASAGQDVELDRRFAGWSIAVSLGQTVGIPLIGVTVTVSATAAAGLTLALAFYAVLAVAAWALSCLPALRQVGGRRRDRSTGAPLTVSRMLTSRGMPSILVTSVAFLVTVDLLGAYLPVLGEARGMAVAAITMILTVRSGASLLARVAMTRIRRRLTARTVLVSVSATTSMAMAGVATSANPWVVGVLVGIAGFAWGLGQPISMTWTATLVSTEHRAEALSLRLTGNRIGQVSLPLAAGALASSAGPGAVFVGTSLLLAATAVVTARAPAGKGRDA